MRTPVGFVLGSCRKADKRKLDSELHTILLVVYIHFSFATSRLQHQIDAPWQMAAFRISNNNGNGTIEIS
jgi:hypothetical protein